MTNETVERTWRVYGWRGKWREKKYRLALIRAATKGKARLLYGDLFDGSEAMLIDLLPPPVELRTTKEGLHWFMERSGELFRIGLAMYTPLAQRELAHPGAVHSLACLPTAEARATVLMYPAGEPCES